MATAKDDRPPHDPYLDDPIDRFEAASFCKFEVVSLDGMRSKGLGPRWMRGEGSRKIFYTRRAILEWLENKDVTPPNLSHPSAFGMRQVLSGTTAGQIERDTGIKLTDGEARAIKLNAADEENNLVGSGHGRKADD
jgi:hypothetical protein